MKQPKELQRKNYINVTMESQYVKPYAQDELNKELEKVVSN